MWRALGKLGKIVTWSVLSLIAVALVTLLVGLFWARSESGRQTLLTKILPLVQDSLTGKLEVGRLEGDLTRQLVLRDVVLRDADGEVAVRVARISLHYNLLGLIRRKLNVDDVIVDGAYVNARYLADGRLNLAALTRPSPEKKPGKPLSIYVHHAHAEAEIHFTPKPGAQPGPVEASVRLDGKLAKVGERAEVTIDGLAVQTARPLEASLQLSGGLVDDPTEAIAMAVHNLQLDVKTTGAELRKLAPAAKLRGAWGVSLHADGKQDAIELALALRPPAGELTVDGTVGLSKDNDVDWRGTLHAKGVDPAAAVDGIPRGSVELEASGQGKNGEGRVELARFFADVAGAHAKAQGTAQLGAALTAQGSLAVDAPDLSRLASLGVPGLRGALKLDAQVDHRAAHTRVDADVHGLALAAKSARLASIDARVHASDLDGSALVSAHGLTVGPDKTPSLEMNTIYLAASGDGKVLAFTFEAHGPHGSEIAASAHGVPLRGAGPYAADATIDRAFVALRGQHWETSEPGHVRIDRKNIVAKLAWTSPMPGASLAAGASGKARAPSDQRLTFDARYGRLDERVALTLEAHGIDAQRLGLLVGQRLPQTQLELAANVQGSKSNPVGEVKLSGHSAKWDARGLDRMDVQLHAHYANERVKASLLATSGAQKIDATLDAPIDEERVQPLEARVAVAKIDLSKLEKLLPPSLVGLKGLADGNVHLWGTTRTPQLEASIALPHWELDGLKRNQATVNVSYVGTQLSAKLAASLAESLTQPAGTVELAMSAPISVTRARKKLFQQLQHTTPITLTANIKGAELSRLPLARFGVAAPVGAGVVEAALELHGTAHEPQLKATVDVRKLQLAGVDQIDASVQASYAQRRAKLAFTGKLRGAPLLTAQAESSLDVQKLMDGQPWKDAPLRVDAQIPSYDLSRVQKLGGVVAGNLRVRGTLGNPTADAKLDAERLRLGELRFARFAVSGGFDGKLASAKIDAQQASGGSIKANASVPSDPEAPVNVQLDAKQLDLQIGNGGLGGLRTLRGKVEASLRVSGLRKQPSIAGDLRVDDGSLAISSDPRLYKDLTMHLNIKDGLVTLEKLAVKVGSGSALASGTARLGGVTPLAVDATAELQKFPFMQGNMGAWVDAKINLKGQREGQSLKGTLTVQQGTANLPKIAGGRSLQSTGPLADVVFTDAVAERQRSAQKKAARTDAPVTAVIAAHIPGPFRVRSKELMTDLKGDFDIELAGSTPRLYGSVQTDWGHVELLGRRYEIERVRVGFDGQPQPDPQLDVRITRQITDTMLSIEVHGTAKKPKLVLSADPAIYDESQIIGIIISGDPGSRQISDKSADSKVVGALSGLLVNKIKDQLAPGLPIDVIKVDTGGNDYAGLGTTRLEVGKYLTDNVYLSYVHQFGTPTGTRKLNSNEANLEYRFKKRYQVASRYGDAGVGAIDFYWSVRY